MARKKWGELEPRTRRLILVLGAFEGALKIAALADLKRRPTAGVRGSKLAWATGMALISSAGLLPILYFVLGRRHSR